MHVTTIEPAGLADLPGAYRVCLRTGDAGRDATGLFADPDLLGHVYVGPYLAIGRGTQLVVADAEGVAGYLLSTDDTLDLEAWAERHWWPPLRARHPPRDDDSPDASLVRLIHHPERADPEVARAFPAHLHIDLLAHVRGLGLGRELVDRVLLDLRGRAVRGVHLGVDPTNANAIGFYGHLGFRAVQQKPEELVMAMSLG